MTPLKIAMFGEVRKHHEKSVQLTDEQMNEIIFHSKDSLRLSYAGFHIIKNIFTPYIFWIPITLKAKHQLGMSRMEYPYYFTKSKLILFSEMDAMMIKLHGGIEGFLEMCSKIDTNDDD